MCKKDNPEYVNEIIMFCDDWLNTSVVVKWIHPKVNTIWFGINSFSSRAAKMCNVLSEYVKHGEIYQCADNEFKMVLV